MTQPQELVPKTYVLELSQANADIVHGDRNGDYTVTFAEPIQISQGDQLALRMASIDSQKTDSQSVVFANDQHIGMSFSYYDYNYPIRKKTVAPALIGDMALNRQRIDRVGAGADNYPLDYEMYIKYHEISTDIFQLDSIIITYVGGAPKVDGEPLGTTGSFGSTTERNVVSYFAFPLFSWIDENGKFHTSVAKPFATSQSGQGLASETIVVKAANTTEPDWKYTYMAHSTNDYDPGSTDWKPTMTAGLTGAHFSKGTFGGEKIIFSKNSFRVTGLTGGIITQKTVFGKSTNFSEQYVQIVNTFGTGASSTTSLPPPGGVKYQLSQGTAGCVLPAGRYDRNTLANLLTRRFTQVGIDPENSAAGTTQVFEPDTLLVINTNDINADGSIYRKILEDDAPSGVGIDFSSNNSYSYTGSNPTTPTETVNVTLGARKFAIEYGVVGAAYQVSDAHQSVNNPDDVASDNIGFFRTGAGSVGDPFIFNEITAATGVIINDLQPQPFWTEVMGLYDNWVVPTTEDDKGVRYFTKKQVNPVDGNDKNPHESAEITTFNPTNSRIETAPTTEATFISTTATPTFSVVGDSPVVNTEGTFYLLEIQGLNVTQSDFIDSDETMPNISAIISKQYNANDIVTGFSDSGIPYVHRGEPQMISSARVRILDPTTKNVVSTLGQRNDVFLNLTTARPVYNPQNVPLPKLPPKPKTQTNR
tara:strand:- start:7463 stop:9574 length:2112 start_codon:yes stop_codon:yes gene_type:complete